MVPFTLTAFVFFGIAVRHNTAFYVYCFNNMSYFFKMLVGIINTKHFILISICQKTALKDFFSFFCGRDTVSSEL